MTGKSLARCKSMRRKTVQSYLHLLTRQDRGPMVFMPVRRAGAKRKAAATAQASATVHAGTEPHELSFQIGGPHRLPLATGGQ